ncbi:MAG: DMT family transporter [Oscillospiraceae bacterium]|nr:DMT family transporter [Oscillospiraceae bacterium]
MSISAILFGFLPILCKQVLNNGLDAQSLVLIRYGMACVMLGIVMLCSKISFKITKKQVVSFIIFGIIGGSVTSTLLSASYTYMYAGIATMFHSSYPIFVSLIMAVFFREKLSWKAALAVALAVGGMALMADRHGSYSLIGILLTVTSGVTLAIYIVSTKKSSYGTLHPIKIVFYICAVSTVTSLCVKLAVSGSVALPSAPADWVRMALIALLCTVVAHSLLAYGVQKLGATTGSVINMLDPFVSLVAGAFMIGEVPSAMAVAGCVLVFAAIFMIVISGGKRTDEVRNDDSEVLN